MKKLLIVMLILAVSISIWGNDSVVRTLPNGMKVVLKQTSSNSVGLYCFVRTGSIHEEEYLGSGISHYLEHVISSGSTTKRSEAEYLEIGASIGALVNAYTTMDHSCYHMQVENQYIDIALEMLSEQIMYCIFDEKEVNREKEVILKEMVYSESAPRDLVGQKLMEIYFSDTYRRFRIIGYPEFFTKLTRDDLKKYYERRFTPYNMVFVVVGNFDIDEMFYKIANTFVDYVLPPAVDIYIPTQSVPVSTYTVMHEFDIEQGNVYIGRPIPNDKPNDYFALTMAAEVLFGKKTSPLFKYFAEDAMLVNYIYSYAVYNPLSNYSQLTTSFEVSEIENIEKIIELLNEKFLEYTKPKKITQNMLNDVVKRYETQFVMQDNTIDEVALMIGNSMIDYNIPNIEEVMITELKKVTIADVQRVINEYYLGNQVIYYAIPTGQKSYFENSIITNVVKTDYQKIVLNERVELLHSQNTEKPIVRLALQLPASMHHETEIDSGTLEFMFELLFTGSKKFPPMQLSDWLEDRNITYTTNVSTLYSEFMFTCMVDDLDGLAERLIDCLTNPLFDQDEIELLKNRYYAHFMRLLSNPYNAHTNFIEKNQYLNPRAQMTDLEKYANIAKLSKQDILNAFKKFITADKIMILIEGDINESKAKKIAIDISSKIPNKPITIEKIPSKLNIVGKVFTNEYPFEQVNITISANAPDVSNKRELIVMDVIDNYLSGSKGRLYQAVRGENDLAYYAYVNYRINNYDSQINVISQTSLDKKDELIHVLEKEISKLKAEHLTQKNIEDAVLENYKMWKNLTEESYFISSIMYYENLGIGYNFLDKMLQEKLSVTPDEVMEVAKKYFETYNVYVSYPSSE